MANVKHALLTAAEIKGIANPGAYTDGEGLTLRVSKTGAKAWVFRTTVAGNRKNIGLGGYPAVGLGEARRLAEKHRQTIRAGVDPVAAKRAARQAAKPEPTVPTFGAAAVEVHKLNMARFKSEKHGKNWLQMLEKYAYPTLGDLPMNEIDRSQVLNVLEPVWTTKQETARRVRQRMRSIFAWGMSHGYLDTNPAGEAISAALPSMPKIREHFRALPHTEMPAALNTIRGSTAGRSARLALEFLALTGARSGEVRGATWDEIDWGRSLWIIPASRMKAGFEHRVPLSRVSIAVLEQAWAMCENDFLFPSPLKKNSGLSDMTLTKVLRTNGLAEKMTVHGIRSTFRVWVSEETATPWAVAELALAHRVGTSVEQAYHRTDLLEKRRQLMEDWADFLADAPH